MAGRAADAQPPARELISTPATSAGAAPETKADTFYDALWGAADLYRNEDAPGVQCVRFTGRFQLDYARVGQEDFEDWVIRRFRVGLKAGVLRQVTVHVVADLQPQEREVYQRLTDAYVAWSPNAALTLTLGKHSAPFTLEGATSSKELLAVDRGNLANNLWFPQEYFPGVSLAGRQNGWHWMLGAYSSGSATREFGRFDGGVFALARLGYDFATRLHVQKAVLALHYVYQERDRHNSFTRPLADVVSLNGVLKQGRWGLRGELAGALGYGGQSDLWGAMLMPTFDLTPKFQAVARLTWLESSQPNGLRFARYEDRVVSGRGDNYRELYLGLNYYLYGHNLKLQTGVQYADMRDRARDGGAYAGWAWTTGLRIGW